MAWFAVRFLSERVRDDGPALYEDSIVIVEAETEELARVKGDDVARRSSHAFRNAAGEAVRWEFREIVDVKELFDGEIGDGSEVYYTFLNSADLENVRTALGTRLE